MFSYFVKLKLTLEEMMEAEDIYILTPSRMNPHCTKDLYILTPSRMIPHCAYATNEENMLDWEEFKHSSPKSKKMLHWQRLYKFLVLKQMQWTLYLK